MSSAPLDLECREVTSERWPDFERLFEARGGPKNCWCMIFRAAGSGARTTDRASRKAAMRRRIASDEPVGILAYQAGEPVAWCSVAPRETFSHLGGLDDGGREGPVWSITCFFTPRRFRGQGIARQLLEAAVAHARSRGARVIEAYPVDPDSPSYRFMGFARTFEQAGFREVGRAGTRRHVMQLTLD